MNQEQSRQPLTVLDPQLPLLAAQAAVQLDNLLLERGTDLSAVFALAARLNNSQITASTSGPQSQLVDFATLSVLNQAIHGVSGVSAQSLDDLAQQATKLTEELSSASTDKPANTIVLEKIRLFCSLLSQCSTAFQHSLYENSVDWSAREFA